MCLGLVALQHALQSQCVLGFVLPLAFILQPLISFYEQASLILLGKGDNK